MYENVATLPVQDKFQSSSIPCYLARLSCHTFPILLSNSYYFLPLILTHIFTIWGHSFCLNITFQNKNKWLQRNVSCMSEGGPLTYLHTFASRSTSY